MAAAGSEATSSAEAAALFAAVDKDGDGELTEEEIKQLSELKRAHSQGGGYLATNANRPSQAKLVGGYVDADA